MQRKSAYENDSFQYVSMGAESDELLNSSMQELHVFLILEVGKLREDQLIYVETRENIFS